MQQNPPFQQQQHQRRDPSLALIVSINLANCKLEPKLKPTGLICYVLSSSFAILSSSNNEVVLLSRQEISLSCRVLTRCNIRCCA